MARLAKLRGKGYFPDPETPFVQELARDLWLIRQVPIDTDATEGRALTEAAAWFRQGIPMVTLHCAPLKLPSGIRGERWYVLTPEVHALIPGAEHQNYIAHVTPQSLVQGGTDGQTQSRKEENHADNAVRKRARNPARKPARKRRRK
jgi:hypothetical protein